MDLKKGDIAPDFSAEINSGKTIKLSDYKGKNLVLYFYPKDNTSGCTKEACEFRDNMDELANNNVEVLGVSPDSITSHEKFIEKFNLNFNLVSDPDNSISTAYGAYGEKSMYGRKYMGIIRSTFLINKEGVIEDVWYKVRVNGHVDAVKKSISGL
jgi:peroxiredoxin Q/BCP